MTRAHPDESGLIERFLKAEALRQFREKAHHARFVAAGTRARRKLLRALGVLTK